MASHCNGSNHHLGCTCGFGGRDGEAKIARTRPPGTRTTWDHADDFCRKTSCPRCGEPVYFIKHNGGSVWLDELGSPWPKHGCFSEDYIQYKMRADLTESGRKLFGIVIATDVIEPGCSGHILVRCSDGSTVDSNFSTEWDLVKLVGAMVTVHYDQGGAVTIYRV